MTKSFEIVKQEKGADERDLELIGKFSKRKLTKDEVYIFSLVLCDNEIDRDFEQFSVSSIKALAEMFVGKSGIFDHNPKTENQSARIFETQVKEHSEKKNSLGEAYVTLNAKAYIPVREKSKALIEEIETGIKKEVSISCSIGEKICSVCGEDMRSGSCRHTPGETYGGKKCYGILKNPTDAYEWSFVAVPAQPAAGVIKSFKGKEVKEIDIREKLKKAEGSITLTEKEANEILNTVKSLESLAKWGEEYKKDMTDDTVKLCAAALPALSPENVRKICSSMDAPELKDFRRAFRKKAEEVLPLTPQLFVKEEEKSPSISQFKI